MARDPYEVQLERVRDWAAGFWNRSEEDTEALRAVIRELDKLREENSAEQSAGGKMSKRKAINTALAAATFQWKGRELVSATIAADKAYDSGRLEGLKEAARLLSKERHHRQALPPHVDMRLYEGIAFLVFHTKKLGKLLRAPKKED